jgi:hypothetical protein
MKKMKNYLELQNGEIDLTNIRGNYFIIIDNTTVGDGYITLPNAIDVKGAEINIKLVSDLNDCLISNQVDYIMDVNIKDEKRQVINLKSLQHNGNWKWFAI